MTENKHAPGPWRIGAPYGHLTTKILAHGGTYVVGTVFTRRWDTSLSVNATVPDAQGEANARLIAAAPALVMACEAVMRPDGHYLECPCRGSDDIWGQGHKHMPRNPTVAICKQLRAALAAVKSTT